MRVASVAHYAAVGHRSASPFRVLTDSSMTGVEVNGCIRSTLMYVQLFLYKFLLNLRISHVSISLSTVFFLI